jgi:hypothetical protein
VPTNAPVRITGAEAGQPLTLLDATGRSVRTYLPAADALLDLHGVAPGLYLLRASDGRTARLVVE